MRNILSFLGNAIKRIAKATLTLGLAASIATAPVRFPAATSTHDAYAVPTVSVSISAPTASPASPPGGVVFTRPKDSYELLQDCFNRASKIDETLFAPGRRLPKGINARNVSYREWWSLSPRVRRLLMAKGSMQVTPAGDFREAYGKAVQKNMSKILGHLAWTIPTLAALKALAFGVRACASVAYYSFIGGSHFLRGCFDKRSLMVAAALILIGCGDNNLQHADASALLAAIAASSVFSNLGRLVTDVERKKRNIPKTKMTIVKGSEDAPKITLKASTADCLGLDMFGHHLGLDQLGERDILFLEANGVPQKQVKKVVKDLVKDGYRPIGARTFIRVKNKNGEKTLGARYLYAMSSILGTLVNLRSYGSMMNAPALNPFEVGEGLTTTREDGTEKEVLFISGSAAKLNKMFNGIEGGIPVSEKAAEAVFGDKLPSQPRVLFRFIGEALGALQKGKISLLAARLFLQEDGTYVAKCRADFGEDDAGKAAWREGYDFWMVEDDTPKGRAADKLKTKDIQIIDPKEVTITGWRLAKAPLKTGSSLVSYQVLALLAKDAGFDELAKEITTLVKKSMDRDVAKVKRDLDELLVGAPQELKDYFAAQAPGSAKAGRRNFLGFGAKTLTGYIDMNTAFAQGFVVTGNEFGPGWKKLIRKFTRKIYAMFDLAGGKNPILDFNQTWVGKNVYLGQIFKAIEEYKTVADLNEQAKSNPDIGEVKISQECQEFLDAFMANIPEEERFNNLKWIAAYAPALSRGSIMMNADDVGLLAGDDDGDQLWFSFNPIFISIFSRIKKQNVGGNAYKIEIDKRCQLVSDFGPLPISILVDEEDDDRLWDICLYMIAPNKGQGPVGYLANLCTVLIATFKKEDQGEGLMAYAIKFVELLQAILNLMSQTSIDLQKREYGAIDPTRWSEADISVATVGNRGLIPGYDFPILNFDFDKKGFDPNSFTKEGYKSRLTRRDVPTIINHWTGKKMSFLTDNDSMYNVGALGSWLVCEIISLIVTGKPFVWNDGKVVAGAEGGLTERSLSKYLSEDGPDIDRFIDELNISSEKADLLRTVWVEKPSDLYRWKKASKNASSDPEIPMPPALRANWDIAAGIKRGFVDPTYSPTISFQSLKEVLKGSFKLPQRNPKENLITFMDMLVDRFYTEAAIALEAKTDSDRFQNAEERSGVEALRLLMDAISELIKDKVSMGFSAKKAQGLLDIINPKKRTKKLEEKVQAVTWLFAWYSIENDKTWRLREVKRILPKSDSPLSEILKEEIPDLSEDSIKEFLKSGIPTSEDNEKLEKYLRANLSEKAMLKLEARVTFFVDEVIGAMDAIFDQNSIISEKRYMLTQVGKLVQWYKKNREKAASGEVVSQMILHAFNGGSSGTDDNPSWLAKVKDDLKIIVEIAEKDGSITEKLESFEAKKAALKVELKDSATTKERKSQIRKEFKALKKALYETKQAANVKELLARTKKEGKTNSAEILLLWLDPSMNPLARKFAFLLRDSITPLVNVERAYNFHNGEKGWDIILGTTKTVDTADGGNKNIFMGYSRVDFELSDRLEAELTRIFINAGTSIYKLNQVPGTNIKTWRFIDALMAQVEKLSDWSIKRGFGHLVSLAKPTEDSRDRLNHLGHLEADIKTVERAPVSDAAKKQAYLANAKEELARIESLMENPLMVRWGQGLLVPITWGLRLASYKGDTTKKKLNGRAFRAIKMLNQGNPEFVYQGRFCVLDPDGRIVKQNGEKVIFDSLDEANAFGTAEYGKQFTPGSYVDDRTLDDVGDVIIQGVAGEDIGQANEEAIGNATPYQSFFNHPAFREDSGELDDTYDMKPRHLGSKSRYTYDEWCDKLIEWAPGAQVKDLLLGTLFYKSNIGAISMLMSHDKGAQKYREAMIRRLMRCASRDAKLHMEVLINSKEKTSVCSSELDRKAIVALLSFLEEYKG